mgnify:CR=1 FL=1
MGVAVERMRGRHLSIRTQALYLGYIEAFLRFHNRPENADHLASRSAAEAVGRFLDSLARESGLNARELVVARRAIRVLYEDVFLVPLERPVRSGNPDPAARSSRCSEPPAADSHR